MREEYLVELVSSTTIRACEESCTWDQLHQVLQPFSWTWSKYTEILRSIWGYGAVFEDLAEYLRTGRSIWELSGELGFNNQPKTVGFDTHDVFLACINHNSFVLSLQVLKESSFCQTPVNYIQKLRSTYCNIVSSFLVECNFYIPTKYK